MTYKIKSLIYLTCFIASSILYYNMNHDFKSISNTHPTVVAKVDASATPIADMSEVVEAQ